MYSIIGPKGKPVLARPVLFLLFWLAIGHHQSTGTEAFEFESSGPSLGRLAELSQLHDELVGLGLIGPVQPNGDSSSAGLLAGELAELAMRGQEGAQLEGARNVYEVVAELAEDEEQPMRKRTQRPMEHQRPVYDLNVHLPANSPPHTVYEGLELGLEAGLRPPANEPPVELEFGSNANWNWNSDDEEQEVALSHLTNRMNVGGPNSSNRTQLILALLEASGEAEGPGDEPLASLPASQPAGAGHFEQRFRHFMRSLYELQAATRQQEQQEPEGRAAESEAVERGDGSGARQEGATSEYIDHPLALAGHQLVQGGAGEGTQLLGPEGTFENVQVLKSDSAVPAYCDPPNPCPLGYRAEDGCLEQFVNSASFSREYQAKQQCSCDNEHSLFNCAAPPQAPSSTGASTSGAAPEAVGAEGEPPRAADEERLLGTLARSLQNRLGDSPALERLVDSERRQADSMEQQAQEEERLQHDLLVRSARKWSQPLGAAVSGGQPLD